MQNFTAAGAAIAASVAAATDKLGTCLFHRLPHVQIVDVGRRDGAVLVHREQRATFLPAERPMDQVEVNVVHSEIGQGFFQALGSKLFGSVRVPTLGEQSAVLVELFDKCKEHIESRERDILDGCIISMYIYIYIMWCI